LHVATRGVDQIGPAAIVEGDLKHEPVVVGGLALGLFDDGGDVGRQSVAAAENAQAHARLLQPRQITGHIGPHQPHQVRDLLGRTAPVLGREAEDGQALDAEIGRGLDRALQRLDPLAMSHGARQAPGARPAAVAVHDDGDMAWSIGTRARRRGAVCRHLSFRPFRPKPFRLRPA
jgi:hypothetical protein